MMAGGRPRTYETSEELEKAIEDYFIYIQGESIIKKDVIEVKGEGKGKKGKDLVLESKEWIRYPEPATITGLSYHLGFESRQSFYDYEKDGEFSYAIKRARLRVEMGYEKNLHGNNNTGSIFALKNLGWKDQIQKEHSGPDGGPIQTENKHIVEFEDFSEGDKDGDKTEIQ